MLCENCQQNQATVHMQQIINGEKREMHLCQECAYQMPISFETIFQGILDSFFKSPDVSVNNGVIPESFKKCPSCGLSYTDFKNTGRLGCSECYQIFRPELDKIFKNVQASTQHEGKFPKRTASLIHAKREMSKLKAALAKSVAEENFEEAVRLRDKIREVERGSAV